MGFLSKEAKVGLFVLTGIIILAYFTLKVGKIEVTDKGYTIYAVFDTISGLDEKSVVKMAGVPIGQVTGISLKEGRAKVRMRINDTVNIPADSSISLASEGLLGEKYIEIVPGKEMERYVLPDGEMERAVSGADVDELIKKVTLIADDIKKVTEALSLALGDEEGKKSVQEIVTNLRDSTRSIRNMVATNEGKVARILDNFDKLSADLGEVTGESKEDMKALIANLREFTDTLKERTPEITEKLEKTLGEVDGLVTENRENVKGAIENIKSASARLDSTLEKIESGEGTLGKLISDDAAYEKLDSTLESVNRHMKKVEAIQTFLDYRLEYQQEPDEYKQYASLIIQPKVDKYYLFGIVDDPQGDVKETRRVISTDPPGTTVTTDEVVISDDLKFNAIYGKKFGDFTFKGGLMESTAGFGVAYRTLSDRLAFRFDFWDVDRAGNRPHLKLYGDYSLFRNFMLTAGYDDFINKDSDFKTIFIGFGISLRDQDLKTLFTAAPPVSP